MHVVCLDGPAGSGKSTISRLLAAKLGFTHLDTGAMYRAVALAAGERGVDLDAAEAVAGVARGLSFRFSSDARGERVWMGERDVSEAIRTPEISRAASLVSRHAPVRTEMVARQREVARTQALVAEGRDMGSVVFPDAILKVYLDATLEERARRRYAEFRRSHPEADLETVKRDVAERDARDSGRAVAPLVAAPDALVLDTTTLTPSEIVERLAALYEERAHAS